MIEIEYLSLKIKKINKFRYKKVFFEKYTLYFFGSFREKINKIEQIINSFQKKNFDDNNLEKLFRNINGICTLIIISDEEIKISASVFHSHLKIFKNNDNLIITENEFNGNFKLSSDNSLLKLFSQHVYFFHAGLSNDVYDFICPGSSITIKKNIKDYVFSWYLDFDKFCSRNDHEKIAEELADSYVNVFDNLDSDKKYYFGLSGGLDSALSFSAALKKIDIQPFHITRKTYSDEQGTAEKVSKYYKKKLLLTYLYKTGLFTLDFKKNESLENSLRFNYDYIKKDSIFFPLNNSALLMKERFPDSHIFTGTSDPLLLTINHFMVYPDRIRPRFEYSKNKNERYFFSIDFFEKLKDKETDDEFNLKKKFSIIDPFYYPLFNSYIDQLPKQYNYKKRFLIGDKSIDIKDSFPVKNLSNNQLKILYEIKFKNACLIFNKILKSNFFAQNLQKPNARTAQILLKFFHFLGQYGKEIHQGYMLSGEDHKIEYTAVNSEIALKQLSTIIDERLVDYSKWHSFRVFEILNKGMSFEKLYKRPSLLDLRYVSQRIHSKINSKFKKLPEHDDRYALINNASLKDFLTEHKIRDKFLEFKSSHDHNNLIYDFPNDDELLKIENLDSNFWKLNNIINLVSRMN